MQQGLTDELYNAVANYETDARFTAREKLAIEYAEVFATDHTSIGDPFFDRLKVHFSDAEILELTITIGYCVGIGRAFHVLDIARDFDVLWSKEPPTPTPTVSAESM